jgi:hypothetical protein
MPMHMILALFQLLLTVLVDLLLLLKAFFLPFHGIASGLGPASLPAFAPALLMLLLLLLLLHLLMFLVLVLVLPLPLLLVLALFLYSVMFLQLFLLYRQRETCTRFFVNIYSVDFPIIVQYIVSSSQI